MAESQNPLGLPYGRRTPQEEGRHVEKKRARAVGARLHPNSGAGSIKDDASSEDALYEFKEANRSHTLDAAALRGLYLRAVRMDKDARYIVHFADGLVADVHLYTGRNHDG